LLRRAAVHVEENDTRELTSAIVDAISEDARRDVLKGRILALGTHQRLLWQIIDEAGELDAGTLHARYEARANSPKSKSSRRRYLEHLEHYELIESAGSTRDRRYRSTATFAQD